MFEKNLKFYCLLLSLFVMFTTCKKEIHQNSLATIKYFIGGQQDKVQSVIKTRDGGFLYIGYTTNALNTDGFLLKVNGNGEQQWYKTYGGAKLDYFKNAVSTSDGGFLAVGASNTESYDTANAATMGYVVKTDANGSIVWEKRIGTKITRFLNVVENTATNGFLITGTATINWPLICLVSMDQGGKVLYNRTYTNGLMAMTPPLYISNLYNMYSNSILLANDAGGNVLLGGVSSKSDNAFETQTMITHIVSVGSSTGLPVNNFYRYNDFPDYNYMWYSTQLNYIRNFPTVKILNAGDGFLVATFTNDSNWNFCMQLIKTDLSANIVNPLWHKEYNGLGNALLNDLNDNGDGTFLLSGTSTANSQDVAYPEGFKGLKTMVMKVGKDGNPLWTQYFGSDDNSNIGMCSQPIAGVGYAIGAYNCSDLAGYHKMFCLFLDKDGKIIQTK